MHGCLVITGEANTMFHIVGKINAWVPGNYWGSKHHVSHSG